MGTIVQFVDSIAAVPTLRLNLNDGATWRTLADGTSFPPPPLQRAVADTLLADGAHIPSAAYGNRTLRLRLQLAATTPDLQATQIQLLARELNRTTNILKWQPDGMTTPVFFRTFRSDIANAMSILPTLREATFEILARPFAYGLKQTLSAATVNNDPAAGSNGLFFDVTSVKGDVETPLYLSCGATSLLPTGGTYGMQSVIAVRRRGTPSAAPFLIQAESGTMSTDTTVTASNDPLMSGSGNNYTRTTFSGTPGITNRITGLVPAAVDSVDVRGTYRVFARVRKSVAGDTITMRVVRTSTTDIVDGDATTLPATTLIRWVDLGLMQMPRSVDPVTDGPSGTELVVKSYTVTLLAARVGSGTLDIDCVLFVPADDRFGIVQWSRPSGPTSFVLDSEQAMAYAVGASGEIRSEEAMPVTGGCPMVSPSVTNRVYFIQDVGNGNGVSDSKTATTTVTPYYWPRYLYVAPATT